MKNIDITTYLRPPKLAFVVSNKMKALRAMEYCTIVWGGLFNEIYDENMLEGKETELLSDFIVLLNSKIISFDKNKRNVLSFEDLWDKAINKPLYSDVIANYQNLRNSRMVFASVKKKNTNLIDAFRFGKFPQNCQVDYEKFYNDSLSPTSHKINPFEPSFSSSYPFFPINVTTHELKLNNFVYSREVRLIFLIGNEKKYQDILVAWNLRSRANKVYFVSVNNFEKSLKKAIDWGGKIKNSIAQESQTSKHIGVLIYCPKKEYEEYAKKLSSKIKLPISGDFPFDIKKPMRPIDYFPKTEYKEVIGFIDGNKFTFKTHPPAFTKFCNTNQKIGVAFELPTVYGSGQNDYVCYVPAIENKEMCLFGSGQNNDVRIHDEAVTEFTFYRDRSVWFYLNSPLGFWKKCFREKDFDIKHSSPGHNLINIIKKYKGIDPGCRIIKLPVLRKLIQRLQNDKSINKNQMWQEIINKYWHQKDFDFGLHHITKENFLSKVCEKGILRQGFELQCSKCMNSSWYSISEIQDYWECKFCNSVEKTMLLSERIQSFKADGLFQIKGGMLGAITSILVLWIFNHFGSHGHINYLPSFEIFKKNEKTPFLECDLLITIECLHLGDADIILVESKSENYFSKDDIEQLKKLEGIIGIETFKCFATTKSTFSSEEIKILKQLYKTDKKLILFTAQELEPYDLYNVFPSFGVKFFFDLRSLSMATVQKHLKPKQLTDIRSEEQQMRLPISKPLKRNSLLPK